MSGSHTHLNIIFPGLLAYRIWMVDRNVSSIRATNGTTMSILRVLVDAALLYSAVLFTTLICFVYSNNGQYIMLDMVIPPLTSVIEHY